jgi:2-keto-4-pentenoate hydratase/2-oxohepta-3-ene-1,7-dioic acid hydratase in catechol pathway
MKLVTYELDGRTSIGKVIDDTVVEIAGAFPGAPATMLELLAGGDAMMRKVAAVQANGGRTHPLSAVTLKAPVPKPEKFLAIGLNYQDHVDEIVSRGGKAPEHQIWFNKQVSCITGPFDPVHLPSASDKLDYEGELAVVIGKRCRHVTREDALEVVAGYMVADDVTARDWQRMSPTWTLGKSFDTHGPLGPWLVTADEVGDPKQLEMRLYVNGELRQRTSTSRMVFDIPAQIAHLSTVMTLEPGDVLLTGTCSGAGFGRTPPVFLQPGDVVRVEIDKLGHIENHIIAEPFWS